MPNMGEILAQIIEQYVNVGDTHEDAIFDAIADVLEELGYVVITAEYYNELHTKAVAGEKR